MATVTKTTVEVTIGQYKYRAELDGNQMELFRDGVSAGAAVWNGGKIEGFPRTLSEDARDELTLAIEKNLAQAWRAHVETGGPNIPPDAPKAAPVPVKDGPKTTDAANHGQLGNETSKPARQGEAEVGAGGPGFDPRTGALGGQALKPDHHPAVDGAPGQADERR
jgi:hypothetical protein